jgi:hypothetical protein
MDMPATRRGRRSTTLPERVALRTNTQGTRSRARCAAGINGREARDAIITAHGNSLALASFHVLFEMTGWGALASCLGSTRCNPKPTSAPPQMHPALIIPIVSEVIV